MMFDEEFPEGIAADAFDPRPEPMTGGEFARDLVQP
jgi:hypothetical protein